MAGKAEDTTVHILWINAGLSCDGDSVALTAAMQPSIEEIVLGALPGLPKVAVHWPLIDFEKAGRRWPTNSSSGSGRPTAASSSPSSWSSRARSRTKPSRRKATGAASATIPPTGQPMTTSEWLDRLAPKALAWSRPAPARPTAASTPWPAIRPARWACPTISAGTGSRRPAFRSSACRAARSSRTTCPRRSSTCSTRPPARRR